MLRGVLIGLLVIAAGPATVSASVAPQPAADRHPDRQVTHQTPVNETVENDTVADNGTVLNQTNPNYRLNATGNHTYRISIGNGSGRMVVILNLSIFGNLPNAGTLGFRSYGFVDNERIIAVEFGIGFMGIGDIWSFFTNPFSRFGIEAQTTLHLPFLDTSDGKTTSDNR